MAHDISYTLPLSGYERCCDSMFRKENAMECYPIVANGKNKVIRPKYWVTTSMRTLDLVQPFIYLI